MTRAGFNELVHSLSRRLYVYAFRLMRERSEAEDIVQEVFIKLWKMNESLGDYKSVEALSFTMTRNQCIDVLRKQKWIIENDTGSVHWNHPETPSPEEAIERAETMLQLDRIIENLSPVYREMIVMRDIEGLTYEEIAGLTNQNINTIRVIISRARKTVRDEYKRSADGC